MERPLAKIEEALPKNTSAKLSGNMKEAMVAAFKEDGFKLEALAKKGVDLSGVGGAAAAEAYLQMMKSTLHNMRIIGAMYGRETKKQRDAALDADGSLRLKLWSALVAMGMPPAEFRPVHSVSDFWLFRYDRSMDSVIAEKPAGRGIVW